MGPETPLKTQEVAVCYADTHVFVLCSGPAELTSPLPAGRCPADPLTTPALLPPTQVEAADGRVRLEERLDFLHRAPPSENR